MKDSCNMSKINEQVEELDRRVTVLESESRLQFKELFIRLKRIEALLIGVAGTLIIGMAGMIWNM